ncbi:MAG TPA: phosphoribosyltransferase family protein, partial [Trebonia sp.]
MGSSAARAGAFPPPPAFRDRAEAGVLLGARLREVTGHDDTADPERVASAGAGPAVFAIPRGGVAVAAGVAQALGVPLGVLMVRKIGHPMAPELGLGAIAQDGAGGAATPYYDADLLRQVGLTVADLAEVEARERAELARRVAVYGRPPRSSAASLDGRLAIVVDDGLATGVTARAALRSVRARGPARTVLAVPVAASTAVRALEREADAVVTLVTPRRFRSVGEWYADFGQLTDDDVLVLLRLSPGGTPPTPPDARPDGKNRHLIGRVSLPSPRGTPPVPPLGEITARSQSQERRPKRSWIRACAMATASIQVLPRALALAGANWSLSPENRRG